LLVQYGSTTTTPDRGRAAPKAGFFAACWALVWILNRPVAFIVVVPGLGTQRGQSRTLASSLAELQLGIEDPAEVDDADDHGY